MRRLWLNNAKIFCKSNNFHSYNLYINQLTQILYRLMPELHYGESHREKSNKKLGDSGHDPDISGFADHKLWCSISTHVYKLCFSNPLLTCTVSMLPAWKRFPCSYSPPAVKEQHNDTLPQKALFKLLMLVFFSDLLLLTQTLKKDLNDLEKCEKTTWTPQVIIHCLWLFYF